MTDNQILLTLLIFAVAAIPVFVVSALIVDWATARIRGHRDRMQYDDYPALPTPRQSKPSDRDTGLGELAVPVAPVKRPGPVPATVLEECPQCGRAYKRVSQHIRMSHTRARQ